MPSSESSRAILPRPHQSVPKRHEQKDQLLHSLTSNFLRSVTGLPVDFVILNMNLVAKLAYHVKILRKLILNVPKKAILAIFTTH